MLTPDFPLPLLLGIASEDLRLRKRLRLDAPQPARELPSESRRESRPTMFLPTGRFAAPPADATRATSRAESWRLPTPDDLDLHVRRGQLDLPLAQLDWSAGTPPVATRDGRRVRVPLGERFVLRLLGTRRRWVLDVRGLGAVLYEDTSPVAVPYLGRPPAESWARTIPMPAWLATLLEEVATGGDDLSPFVAVGLLLRHADSLAAEEAVEWLRAVADGVPLEPIVGEARARADALAARIVARAPGDAAATVEIRRDREHLACASTALRALRRGASLTRTLAAVDARAAEHLATLQDPRASVEAPPPEVVFAPTGWWAGR